MQVSVIIVNYNVRHFLEQALGAVRRGSEGLSVETWVVDNCSTDDSVAMVRQQFESVNLIVNTTNPGFSIANNQAIRQSTGKYVLLLNPDTLIAEDTLSTCYNFMENHPEAGALGVKMIDGSGQYLPESKRGFPAPWVAFCKTFGLSALFPKSRLFNQYYLGYYGENDTIEVDVLAGCFMFIRAEALANTGLLDEAFFMYGEDIDLSYRLVKAGYKNYYLPDTQIIHYKGESTKKGSLNYVKTFYQAMIIFARKHFTGSRAGVFITMLYGAIWLRAGMTLVANLWQKIWLPFLDAIVIYGGLVFLKNFWANYFYKDPDWFKPNVLWFNFPLYILIWLGTMWLNGGYDNRYAWRRMIRGLSMGTLILAAVYGFLDLDYRPSRALVLMGAVWSVISLITIRLLTHYAEFGHFSLGTNAIKNTAIVGSLASANKVGQILMHSGAPTRVVGHITPEMEAEKSSAIGQIHQLATLAKVYELQEIIFCAQDISSKEIIHWIQAIGPSVAYKIVPIDSEAIIGSSNKETPGEQYTTESQFSINQLGQRRNKRLFDLVICALLAIGFPVFALFSKSKSRLYKGLWPVCTGQLTWVGYAPHPDIRKLPALKSAVFTTADGWPDLGIDEKSKGWLNFWYAKHWTTARDWRILTRNW